MEQKEGDPQAQVAQDLIQQLQEKEEAERIQKASEQLLIEGATKEEVEAEVRAAAEAKLAIEQQQDRERVDKEFLKLSLKVRDFLSPVPVITYMKNLTTKQKGRGNVLNADAVSNILDAIEKVNAYAKLYLQQYPPNSFKEEDFESNSEVKKLYVLSFLLKRIAKITQLSPKTKDDIKEATESMDKIFSSGLKELFNEVDKRIKETYPKYAGFIQRIRDLNK